MADSEIRREVPPKRRPPAPETIASYWRVVVPIIAFFLGGFIVVYDIVIEPPIDQTTSIIGVVIAGFGPAIRDVLGK